MTLTLVPDFQRLFESIPGMYLVLTRDFNIVAVSDAHLVATMSRRDAVVGRGVFDAYPDNPEDPTADGVQNFRASLERVLRFRAPDLMPIQRYAIKRSGPAEGPSVFGVRYWKILSSPSRDADGTVQHIIVYTEDLTELHDLSERQRMLESLQRKQEELRVSQEVARIGTFEWNIETDAIEWFAGVETLYGLPVGGLDSFKAWTSRIHPEDRAMAERAVAVAFETGEFSGEWRSLWPDGTLHWIALRGTIKRDVTGKPLRMVGATIDVTIRKEAELFRTQLASIVESSDDAIISSSLDGTILSWNTSAERIFGYPASEAIDKNLMLLVPPDKIEEEKVAIAERLKRGEGVDHIETVRLTKCGKRIDVSITLSPMRDASGTVFAASRVCRDITAQKVIDETLRLTQVTVKTLERALDAHAMVAITDQNGAITYVNDAFCNVAKYSSAELIGQNHRILNSGHHPAEFFCEMWGVISRGLIWKGEIQNRDKAGTHYWVATTIVPFVDVDGKPYQYVAIQTDITQRRHAEEQAALAHQELHAFSYSVSHDLRAPLRGIDGWSLALKEDCADQLDARCNEFLDRIRSETQHMGLLIDALLRLSSITQSQMHPANVDLSRLASGIGNRLRELSPERKVEFVVEDGMSVVGDSGLLSAALTNLIDNAWKFTGKKPSARIEFGKMEKDGAQAYFVRDNGAGFNMTHAENLFSPFQRAHKVSEFPGTGIGLATVQRVVQRHGGRVWVESEVDRGTTFYFTLASA